MRKEVVRTFFERVCDNCGKLINEENYEYEICKCCGKDLCKDCVHWKDDSFHKEYDYNDYVIDLPFCKDCYDKIDKLDDEIKKLIDERDSKVKEMMNK